MEPRTPIYLDAHATTPCDPRVVEAMMPTFTKTFGNASSRQHRFGWEAEALVESARESIARLLDGNPKEIVFTSGATESNNLAIKGAARAHAAKGKRLVTSAIEHKSVLDSFARLEQEGFHVTYLRVDSNGLTRVEDVERALTPETTLVSIMTANNEIGIVNPIAEIGSLCKSRGILFHTDAAQAAGYLRCGVTESKADLVSISAHKMYGPKGVGALFVRRRDPRARLEPFMDGGGHERGLRSGTLNVSGIVGLGKAAEIALAERETHAARLTNLRNRLLSLVQSQIPDAVVNGSMTNRLPHNLNLSFPGVDGESLLAQLRDLAVSSGSACSSTSLEPSYVIRALGRDDALAHASIRFGLLRTTTEAEIDFAAENVVAAVQSLRSESPAAPACHAF